MSDTLDEQWQRTEHKMIDKLVDKVLSTGETPHGSPKHLRAGPTRVPGGAGAGAGIIIIGTGTGTGTMYVPHT
ncbi:hypothetical protein E2P81_ATG06891 [Venturia nashicola]|nr:hypothetical protein E2P81_ATG06891 [Venturia nashicola]